MCALELSVCNNLYINDEHYIDIEIDDFVTEFTCIEMTESYKIYKRTHAIESNSI